MSKKITVALITYCLYPKPLDPLPLPIAWGQHHESTAIQKYIACKKKVTVKKCGFIIGNIKFDSPQYQIFLYVKPTISHDCIILV